MSSCPWYVSANAVRAWQRIDPAAPRDFDEASDRLIEVCAEIWSERYADGERSPTISRTGAYVYRAGRAHGRMQLVVARAQRAEGAKHQVVDVCPASGAHRARKSPAR